MPILSGDESKKLWKAINKIAKAKSRKKLAKRVGKAMYLLACACQELEMKPKQINLEL